MKPIAEFHTLAARFYQSRRGVLLFAALVGFGLSIGLIGKLVFSGYSILDDHDILQWLAPDRHLALSNFWSTLMTTEVGQPDGRFRPVMYSSIIFQTWLWGPHPAGYHVVAVLWFAVFLWSIAWVCFRSIGVAAGCVILFLIVDGRYWQDIFTHSVLVSEQSALLGLGLMIFGFGLAASWFMNGCRDRLDTSVLLVSVGSLICAGAKENFQPPTGLSILLLLVAWRMKKIGTGTSATAAILNLLSLAVCLRIILPNFGHDSQLSYRLWAVVHSVLFKYALLSLLAGAASIAFGMRDRARRDTRDARAFVVLGAILLAAGPYLLWEIFFYDGRIPDGSDARLPFGSRYDFPALLIYPILVGALFFAVLQIRKRHAGFAALFSLPALELCFVLLMLNAATAHYVRGRLLPIVSSVAISNSHTQLMAVDLTKTRELTAQHPDWPILVAPDHPFDYELMAMVPTWFHFYGVDNPASMVVMVPPQNIKSAPEQDLVKIMQYLSATGDRTARFTPISAAAIARAESDGHCYVVTFQNFAARCTRLPYRPEQYLPQY